jgi:hypothetical protein
VQRAQRKELFEFWNRRRVQGRIFTGLLNTLQTQQEVFLSKGVPGGHQILHLKEKEGKG